MIIPSYFTVVTDLRADKVMLILREQANAYTGLSESEIDIEKKKFRLVRRSGSLGYPSKRFPWKIILVGSVRHVGGHTIVRTWALPSVFGTISLLIISLLILRIYTATPSGEPEISTLKKTAFSLAILLFPVILMIVQRNKSRGFLRGLLGLK
jgi:hypothetical protein